MRLQRWAIILPPFNYSIKSFPSMQNAVADALSRLPFRQRPMTKILHTMLKGG